MELGGNGPCMIFNSADLQRAVQGAFLGKFRNGGQVSRKHIIKLKNQMQLSGEILKNFGSFTIIQFKLAMIKICRHVLASTEFWCKTGSMINFYQSIRNLSPG